MFMTLVEIAVSILFMYYIVAIAIALVMQFLRMFVSFRERTGL